uniref:Glycoprotein 3-alpha-L-fucosyltransferase A n=1 Tax=Anoplophora glabripennis TaxID=217634 RepID=V5G3Y4_ANOGL
MPPRLSARRLFLVILFFLGVSLLVSLHHRFSWVPSRTTPMQADPEPDDELVVMASVPSIVQNYERVNSEETEPTEKQGRPWFMAGGTEYPTNYKGPPRLFPDQADGDRVVDQLMYVPEDYQGYDTPEKVILAYNGLGPWGQKSGSASFHGCPVNRCTLTDDRSKGVLVK